MMTGATGVRLAAMVLVAFVGIFKIERVDYEVQI
jgi:hypothetical protein